ncbi:uncharacterized protein FTOL_10849 [Fusarium torulosum]|uniref:DUF676 domain-containing protein n=1 Tax=Fusarium torulosum TaxID=33205 RepID=A0AAE8MHE1_9HYPO|nr:uncharacterized protein FTOL_10849 [Fusarium torulosum]
MRPQIDPESHLPYIEPPSHVGLKAIEIPPPYTGTPWLIFISDVKLFFQNVFYLLYLFIPLYPWRSGSLCEMYPSRDNLTDIALHLLLSIAQLTFLVSLVTLAFLPTFTYIGYIAVKNWFQKNIDRISRTFHRPVTGIHNRTAGVVFDFIQCLFQRALLYATQDVRECYVLVKNALLDDRKKKVIFILHSQGGIEGGMIIDWLLDEMPLETLQKLEVYTFGNTANHFSNPCRGNDPSLPVIPHIEHYVNDKDFACRFGVLNFTKHYTQNENRFAGKVFINRSGGHLLNQHYLDDMLPLDKSLRKTREVREGDFMNRKVRCRKDGTIKEITRAELPLGFSDSRDDDAANGMIRLDEVPRIGDLSRLWKYRNGQLPD